ncbi:hypothetical protein ACVWY2_009943 [Bradyrhizobium sp. JR6.1]
MQPLAGNIFVAHKFELNGGFAGVSRCHKHERNQKGCLRKHDSYHDELPVPPYDTQRIMYDLLIMYAGGVDRACLDKHFLISRTGASSRSLRVAKAVGQ